MPDVLVCANVRVAYLVSLRANEERLTSPQIHEGRGQALHLEPRTYMSKGYCFEIHKYDVLIILCCLFLKYRIFKHLVLIRWHEKSSLPLQY